MIDWPLLAAFLLVALVSFVAGAAWLWAAARLIRRAHLRSLMRDPNTSSSLKRYLQ